MFALPCLVIALPSTLALIANATVRLALSNVWLA